ncbi:F-box/LRR-repeat protein 7-like isoform X1 [Leguminivora glycinivorella]|uniref:F-box/LRR-repeat protein 7-like isoform X1 n=1 Tax=Leguminivora glycinivorella TaxID=1035111 RepID=UPI00200F1826|nr:F-box/LRR-repeat protein 7-like isoform X1 [Leguminivora glycinivorella]
MWEFEDVLEEALEDARVFGPELLHVARREIYALNSNLDITPYGLRSVPTHTEDGIPIRKLYVSNLPPKTSRTELFGVFAQYGFIKSCWLRMGDRGPNRTPTPTYAFVTFSDPADAHKALMAPDQEKILKGYKLKTSPADSWHQPAEDADGQVLWKSRTRQYGSSPAPEQGQVPLESSTDSGEAATQENNAEANAEDNENTEKTYTILDILNRDCLAHVLNFIPIIDLIRSERVSKRWQSLVQEHINGIRKFKTSWWQHGTVTLTTAVLRRVLQRLGPNLTKLHIDHHWSALNDRTAHTVGKFCPNLEELKVVGMYTKNWNPLIYGCKFLKALTFVSCNKLSDSSLVRIVKSEASIESITVANNTHVTGLFLTGSNPPRLHTLSFYNCYSLQGTVICAAIDTLPNLKTLRLDVCPVTMWKIIPLILNKLPQLEELSLSEYTSMEVCSTPQVNIDFCESLSKMTELKVLNLSRNIYINNAILKTVAQTCSKLESLNISSCNSRKINPQPVVTSGVSDEGILTICRSCTALRKLDISYIALLTDAGVAAAVRCARLASLTARGNASLTAAPFTTVLDGCTQLQELDVCGCDSVSEELVEAATAALARTPRPLVLRMGGTAAMQESYPSHKLLVVDTEDLSNPHLRPDFVDRIFEDSSDDSLDDPYDHDNFDDFFGSDGDEEGWEDLDYDDAMYAYGLHPQNMLLM